MRSAELDILVAPANAEILVNGKKYTNGHYKTFPGKAKVTISADGFETKELEVELKAHENTLVQAYLLDKDGGLNAYIHSAEDYALLKLLTKDELTADFATKYEAAIKLKNLLPIHYAYPGSNSSRSQSISGLATTIIKDISKDSRCKSTFCIEVSGTKKDEASAKYVLDLYGIDINFVEVYYAK